MKRLVKFITLLPLRRILALVLVLCLTAGVLPLSVLAEGEEPDTAQTPATPLADPPVEPPVDPPVEPPVEPPAEPPEEPPAAPPAEPPEEPPAAPPAEPPEQPPEQPPVEPPAEPPEEPPAAPPAEPPEQPPVEPPEQPPEEPPVEPPEQPPEEPVIYTVTFHIPGEEDIVVEAAEQSPVAQLLEALTGEDAHPELAPYLWFDGPADQEDRAPLSETAVVTEDLDLYGQPPLPQEAPPPPSNDLPPPAVNEVEAKYAVRFYVQDTVYFTRPCSTDTKLSDLTAGGDAFLGAYLWCVKVDDGSVESVSPDTTVEELTQYAIDATTDRRPDYNQRIDVHVDVDSDKGKTVTLHRGDVTEEVKGLVAGKPMNDMLKQRKWKDGTLLTDWKWYTDADFTTQVDATTLIGDDVPDLYTPAAWRPDFDLETAVLTLPVTTAGQTVTDQAINRVYSGYRQWAWKDQESGQYIDFAQLVDKPLTNRLELKIDSTATTYSGWGFKPACQVSFYIRIDGTWQKLGETRSLPVYQQNLTGRCHLPEASLAAVYSEYDYKEGDIAGDKRKFAHEVTGKSGIWADAPYINSNDTIFVPITTSGEDVDIFYLPSNGDLGSDNYEKGKTPSTVLPADSFYTIQISDPDGLYNGDKPQTPVTLTGHEATFTVPAFENSDLTWKCVSRDGQRKIDGVSSDGQVTFTVDAIDQPYLVSPDDGQGARIVYDINVPPAAYDNPLRPGAGKPGVKGDKIHTERAEKDATTITLLPPSHLIYYYKADRKNARQLTFRGWQIGNAVYQPGDTVNIGHAATVDITAKWSDSSTEDSSSYVNFYVNIKAAPEGQTNWDGSTGESDFTSAVFTSNCGVPHETAVRQELFRESSNVRPQIVLGDTNAVGERTLDVLHQEIVENLTKGYPKVGQDGNTYTYAVRFPTDEEVLMVVRGMVAAGTTIKIGGSTLQASDLTTSRFTVKWNVFKRDSSERSDGWHIDGVLVAKTGYMEVKKIFFGNEEVIQSIKSQTGESEFSIQVQQKPVMVMDPDTKENIPTYGVHTGATLKLTPGDGDGWLGYDSVSDDELTYSWKIPVDEFYQYEIWENNYSYHNPTTAGKQYNCVTQYRIVGSSFQSENGGGTYKSDDPTETGGPHLTFTGQNYQSDRDHLTVTFQNAYLEDNVLIIQKIDKYTGNPVPYVEFDYDTVTSPGTHPLYKHGTGVYSYDPDWDTEEGQKQTYTIKADENGQIRIYKLPSQDSGYTFQEKVPDGWNPEDWGYETPGKITLVWQEGQSGKTDYGHIEDWWLDDETDNIYYSTAKDSQLLTVYNWSENLIDVTVQKQWLEDERTNVTLQLLRNGVSMGDTYQAEFETFYNEGMSKTKTFEGLPAFVDGAPAVYSLRETVIGEYRYSPNFTAGYEFYDVTYDSETTDDGGLLLTAKNRRIVGEIHFKKTNTRGVPLSGAEFWLYNIPRSEGDQTIPSIDKIPHAQVVKDTDGDYILQDKTPIAKTRSGTNGFVIFNGVTTGWYYFVEHSPPAGYLENDRLYAVYFDRDLDLDFYVWEGDDESGQWKPIGDTIENISNMVGLILQTFVTGNAGDRGHLFKFTVSWPKDGQIVSHEFNLHHGQKEIIDDIPKDATVTIKEEDAIPYGYELIELTADKGEPPILGEPSGDTYSITYQVAEDAAGDIVLTVINEKNINVDTGVSLDSLPYGLLLGASICGAVLTFRRRRRDGQRG